MNISNRFLVGAWLVLACSAIYYFWWSTNGEWINHVEPTLLSRDAVRFGETPMALALVWFALFLICLRFSTKRLGQHFFPS